MSTLGQDIAGTLRKQITEAGGVRTTDLDNQGAYVRTFSIVPEGGQGADLRASEQDQAGSLTKIHGHDRGTFVAESPTAFRPTGGSQSVEAGPLSPSIKVGSGVGIPSPPGIQHGLTVRRLTPVECERLMSWPDGWTAVDGDATPDGRRYAACGDGVVSNVSEWIGRRILAVDRMWRDGNPAASDD